MKSSSFEPRTCILSVILLTLSAYSFRIDTALAITLVTLIFNPKRTLKGLKISLPFLLFFAVISLLLGGFEKIPTVISLVCIGCLLNGISAEEFGYTLMGIGVPPKFANSIIVAMRMFQIILRDFELSTEALRVNGERRYHLKLLKVLTSIAVLRAFSVAEALYSKGFDFDKKVVRFRKPEVKDYLLLLLSIAIFCYTYPIRSVL